jgi:uncharacterized membrane protein
MKENIDQKFKNKKNKFLLSNGKLGVLVAITLSFTLMFSFNYAYAWHQNLGIYNSSIISLNQALALIAVAISIFSIVFGILKYKERQERSKGRKGYLRFTRLGIPDSSEIYNNSPVSNDPQLRVILQYLIQWEHMALYLRGIHIALGVFATFFSLLAAAQIGSMQNDLVKIFAFIAAVSIALMTGFNLGEKSNNVRTARRGLNTAIMRYNNDPIPKKKKT